MFVRFHSFGYLSLFSIGFCVLPRDWAPEAAHLIGSVAVDDSSGKRPALTSAVAISRERQGGTKKGTPTIGSRHKSKSKSITRADLFVHSSCIVPYTFGQPNPNPRVRVRVS